MENNFILSEGEKIRILNLHENATKKQYLSEQPNPQVKQTPASLVKPNTPVKPPVKPTNETPPSFPDCIKNSIGMGTENTFDPPTKSSQGFWYVMGHGKYDGLMFYPNYRYVTKDNKLASYSCSGNDINLIPTSETNTTQKQPVKLQTTVNSFDDVAKGQYLHFGSRGNAVKELQLKLGINPPTEYFGNVTQTAVIDFQTKNGLNPDGIVEPKTYQALKDQDFKTAQSINKATGTGGLPDYSKPPQKTK